MGHGGAERRVGELIASGCNWTESEAREVLDACDTSGESAAAFARRLGIDVHRLWRWRRRLSETTSFVPVDVVGLRGTAPAVVVTTEGGVRVEVSGLDATSAEWVATMLGKLGARR